MLQLKEDGFKETVKAWPKISHSLSAIRTQQHYKKTVEFADALIDEVGNQEKHPLAPLLELLTVLIEDYENKHVEEPKGDPISTLQFLLEENNLTQSDLPEIGSQGVVSEILHRKRQLNLRQIKALAKRFHVSPSVFIED